MPYTEGAHDSPADRKDRLARVGTKYQSTPDTVSDGDNVYLAVDSSGRLIVVGSGVHGSAAAANALVSRRAIHFRSIG